MLDETTNGLKAAWATDSIHPNATGYAALGTHYAHYQTTLEHSFTVKATAAYPDRGNYDHWLLTGAELVGGYPEMANGETADSPIWYIGDFSLPTVAGVTWYYRRAATDFVRNAAGDWTQYTGAVAEGSNKFTQIRAAATGNVTLPEVRVTVTDRTCAAYSKGSW